MTIPIWIPVQMYLKREFFGIFHKLLHLTIQKKLRGRMCAICVSLVLTLEVYKGV